MNYYSSWCDFGAPFKESPSVQRERARFAYNKALETLEVTSEWKAVEKAWEAVKATPEYKAYNKAFEAMKETPECKNCLEAQREVEVAYMRTENGHLDGRYKWI